MADDLVGSLQAEFAFEEGLGVSIVLEDGAVAVVACVQAALGQEGGGLVASLIAGDLEVDGSLWKCLIEEGNADGQADDGDDQAGDDEVDIFFVEPLFHGYLSGLAAQTHSTLTER